MKEKIISIFLFVIAFILGTKVVGSELYFLIKLSLSIVITGLVLVIFLLLSQHSLNIVLYRKRLLSFFMYSVLLTLILNFSNIFTQDTPGFTIFLYYLGFFIIFNFPTYTNKSFLINSLVSLVIFSFIPFFYLDQLSSTIETVAVLGFLTLIITSTQFILISRQNAKNS